MSGRSALGFLAPMPSELKPLQKALGMEVAAPGGSVVDAVHTGSLDGRPVVAMLTGIGVERAARRTEQLLDGHDVDHVIVIGVAGGLGADISVGDVVIPEVVVDLSDGHELRPTPLGSTPARGRLLTGGALITDLDELARLRAAGATAIDMETAAIARVCAARGVAWSVFRGISDDAFDPTVDDSILALTRPDGSPDLGAVARFVAGNPARIRLLARLGRGLKAATNGAVDAALRACREGRVELLIPSTPELVAIGAPLEVRIATSSAGASRRPWGGRGGARR